MEKLQQIHGYIQQTSSAMQALENEGDLVSCFESYRVYLCRLRMKIFFVAAKIFFFTLSTQSIENFYF